MSAEDEVLAAMQAHVEARARGDIQVVVDSYSEEWSDDKGYRKQTLSGWHLGSIYEGTKLDITIDLRAAEIVIDGDEAIISPVCLDSAKGRITYSHRWKKEADNIWRLIHTQTIDWEPQPMNDESQARKDEIDSTAMLVREHREALLSDRWRPGYHFVVPEGVAMPFDPNGAIYWKGRYHLFYIFRRY